MKRIVISLGMVVTLAVTAQLPYGAIRGGATREYNPRVYGDADWIYFSNGIKFDIRNGEPGLAPTLKIENSDYYVVHCRGPIYPDFVAQIEATGARVYSYISNYAFLVKMDALIRYEVELIPFVDWIGVYQPAYKMSGQFEFQNLQGQEKITILLYPDAEFDGVIDFLAKLGGQINEVAESEWDKLITCEIDLSHLPEIAKLEAVAWIEPWHKLELQNNNVQWILQTCSSNNRRVWNMGIRGNGELCSTSDSGIRTSHYAFRSTSSSWITTWGDYPSDRKIIAYKPANTYGAGYADFGDEALSSYHGTHTAGTITGDDTLNATDLRDGMAIKARIYFLDGGGSQGAVYLPGNLNTLYAYPHNGNAAGSVKIMSNSWGGDAEGAYDAFASQTDQFMWNNKDFLLFFSNGNNPPNVYVGSPASAKNVVSVGSCGNSSSWNALSSFSARGPTNDGRRKPTILAPGASVYSANGAGDTGYWVMSGTSMACPGAAGAGVLVRQYFTDGWYPTGSANPTDSFAPSAALIKAMLVNSADPSISSHTVPDDYIGWGRIDLDSVLYFSGDARKLSVVDDNTGLTTSNYIEYIYNIFSSTVPLRVTLVWTDYWATAGAGKKLINDLDLTITDPNLNQYFGNVYSGGQSITGGAHDSINVEECFRLNTPSVGEWTIRVDGVNCPYGPQPFALVVTGDFVPGGIYDNTIGAVPGYGVYPSYPNPVTDKTCFTVNLAQAEGVKIVIYDALGQLRQTLNQTGVAGLNKIYWYGTDNNGSRLPNGVYFYKIETLKNYPTGKLIIQR